MAKLFCRKYMQKYTYIVLKRDRVIMKKSLSFHLSVSFNFDDRKAIEWEKTEWQSYRYNNPSYVLNLYQACMLQKSPLSW